MNWYDWFKLKALLCNELRNPTSSIKIKPSQAAMCSYLSIFICHSFFTGIKSKTMETHRRENIQKFVHGPWHGHSSNMDFSKHRLCKQRSQTLFSFINACFLSSSLQILKCSMGALDSQWNHMVGLFPQNKCLSWSQQRRPSIPENFFHTSITTLLSPSRFSTGHMPYRFPWVALQG